MRAYTHVRIDPNLKFEMLKFLSFFNKYVYKIQKKIVFK